MSKPNKLNCCAYNVTKPQKPKAWNYKGASDYLNKNRKGIAKLRQRGFSWSQVTQVLEGLNAPINYNNLYQWQLRTFR